MGRLTSPTHFHRKDLSRSECIEWSRLIIHANWGLFFTFSLFFKPEVTFTWVGSFFIFLSHRWRRSLGQWGDTFPYPGDSFLPFPLSSRLPVEAQDFTSLLFLSRSLSHLSLSQSPSEIRCLRSLSHSRHLSLSVALSLNQLLESNASALS